MSRENSGYKYEVALSFAGEDRSHAEQLAKLLDERNVSVFYDYYEKANLWGKDLYKHLKRIYRDESQFCVIFISQTYAEKLWTQHELRAAQARAFKENKEYILPLRIDGTSIPDVVEDTVGYLDLKQTTLEEIADILESKLKGNFQAINTQDRKNLEGNHLQVIPKSRNQEDLRASLLDVLSERLSREELRSVCYALLGSGSAYQSISSMKYPNISIELISYFERRNQLNSLINYIKKVRPDIQF